MCGLVTIDDSRWLMVVAIGEGQRFLEGDFVALERCNLDFVVDLFGHAVVSVTEGYICAVLVDFAVNSRGGSINRTGLSNPKVCVCVCVLCMFFTVGRSRRGSANSAVISLEHCENAFFCKLQRPAII